MKIKKYIAFNFDSGKMIAYDKPPQGIGGSKYKNPVIVIEVKEQFSATHSQNVVYVEATQGSDHKIIINGEIA